MNGLRQTLIVAAMIFAATSMAFADSIPDPRLCVDGHPRLRAEVHPKITYGHLPTDPCCERDHFIPLGLCIEDWCDVAAHDPRRPPGADNPGNVWYQPWPAAHKKNPYEIATIRGYCKGKITLDQAWLLIRRRWSEPQ